MTIDYPWYSLITSEDNIEQGDFIEECPIIIPPKKLDQKKYNLDVKVFDVIIVSQSCDIEQDKIEYILVCRFYPLSKIEKFNSLLKTAVGKEILRRGNYNGLHLLNKCEFEEKISDYIIVDFRNVYSIYKQFLFEFVKTKEKRLRLLSPYREHLSQAFARFFMRIGLPHDIPPFTDEIYNI